MTTKRGHVRRMRYNTRRVFLSGLLVLLAVVDTSLAAHAATGSASEERRGWTCAMTSVSVTLTLSDHEPGPIVRAVVGQEISVLVPPWRATGSSPVSTSSGSLRASCTVQTSDGWRRAVFHALMPGRATLWSSSDATGGPVWQGAVDVVATGAHASSAQAGSW